MHHRFSELKRGFQGADGLEGKVSIEENAQIRVVEVNRMLVVGRSSFYFYYFYGFTVCGDPSRMRVGAALAC